MVLALLVGVIDHARRHPVVAKILADERELVGELLEEYPEAMARIVAASRPCCAPRWMPTSSPIAIPMCSPSG